MKVQGMVHGLYEIYWKSGGSSLAAVGYDSAGYNWLCPCNWITGPSLEWNGVSHVKIIVKNDYSKNTKSIYSVNIVNKKIDFNTDNFKIELEEHDKELDKSIYYSFRENGEPNIYTVLKDKDWFMQVQVNGEISSANQVEIIKDFINNLNNNQ